MRAGRVAVIGAAPPCETWSIARWYDIAHRGWHNRAQPVPLRHFDSLWGRSDLTRKEHVQVRTANVLLIYAIAFATLATFYGIDMWMEHPDTQMAHHDVGAPSIWFLEQVLRLKALPTTRSHSVQHNHYYGVSKKPTCLLAIRMPTLQTRLAQWKRYRAPVATLVGVNDA